MATQDAVVDEYRTGYIKGRWNVSKNCARAFQLFELGKSSSGAAKILGVTESTARKYNRELAEKISPAAVGAITSAKKRWDVYGDRSAENYDSASYEDGLKDGRAARNEPVTTCKEQAGPYFRQQEMPVNPGVPLDQIDAGLIEI